MASSFIEEIAAALAAGVTAGGIFTKLADVWLRRRRGKAQDAARDASADAELRRVLSHATTRLIRDYERQLGFVRDHCNRLEAGQQELKTQVDGCETHRIECERKVTALEAEVERLLQAGKVADYDTLRRFPPNL